MIVPAKRRFFDVERFAKGKVKLGETFSIDSGLGGSWTVEYVSHEGNGPVFKRRARHGWPEEHFRYPDAAETARHVFILVPGYPWDRSSIQAIMEKGGAR